MINTLFRMKRPFALPVSSIFVGLSQPQPTSTVQVLPVSTPAAILAPSGIRIKLGLGLPEEGPLLLVLLRRCTSTGCPGSMRKAGLECGAGSDGEGGAGDGRRVKTEGRLRKTYRSLQKDVVLACGSNTVPGTVLT